MTGPLASARVLVQDETDRETLTEQELLLYIKSKVLRRLTIVENSEGQYHLDVGLTVSATELRLTCWRGRTRVWVSLDSVAKLIRGKYGSPACIALSLGQSSVALKREASAPSSALIATGTEAVDANR